MSNTGRLGADLLKDLADKLAAMILSRLSVAEDVARQIADSVADAVADDWGGQSIYIPMNRGALRAARNAQVFKEFKGDNHQELARKFGLSDSVIYRIIKAESARRRLPQGSLFNN